MNGVIACRRMAVLGGKTGRLRWWWPSKPWASVAGSAISRTEMLAWCTLSESAERAARSVVFTVRQGLEEIDFDRYAVRIAQMHGVQVKSHAGHKQMMLESLTKPAAAGPLDVWQTRQICIVPDGCRAAATLYWRAYVSGGRHWIREARQNSRSSRHGVHHCRGVSAGLARGEQPQCLAVQGALSSRWRHAPHLKTN